MKEILFRIVCFFLFPILVFQGIRARKKIPRLLPAEGPNFGKTGGSNPVRLLVLGESTVAGVGAKDQKNSLTGQIAYALSRKTGKKILWRALGESGITAKDATETLIDRFPDEKPDIVVIALGGNDVMRLRSRNRWASDLRTFIELCRKNYPDAPILVTGIPPVGIFPALPRILRFVLGWNAKLLDRETSSLVTRLKDVYHVPIETLSTVQKKEEIFASDGFHPSPKGYSIWASEIADRIPHLRLL